MNNKNKKGMYNNLIYVTQIGISMVTSILLGFFIGRFLDNKLGTNWVFSLVFLALGIIAGFLNLFKLVKIGDKKRK
ncbi:AtpZ/AtpI family protein [Tepidimicrobium xylanilyticum]|uniref:AtpZ/AtpI family protein n=1 Tax=Tepidimicrobium xylanilyticum TaxID=1123352 RepID=UPI00264F4CC7|nr:AtpZ/AtpI family protein [Tepidimicrobium xylanilyticum]GMG95545.1 AtpZ/AtpI family protein [Tepidimicrobium xylanilyticum]